MKIFSLNKDIVFIIVLTKFIIVNKQGIQNHVRKHMLYYFNIQYINTLYSILKIFWISNLYNINIK